MPKVLSIVSYNFLPPKMGGQKGIALFNQFIAKEINLVCVTTKSNDETYAKDYKVIKVLSNSPTRYLNIFLFFSIKKIIQKEKITHLIIEHPYYGWLGIILKLFAHVKLIVHSHNIESLRFKTMNKSWWKILWYYEKLTHRNAHLNFFINQNDYDYAIANFVINPNKARVITYGFDLKEPASKAEKTIAKQSVCKQHNIDESETILFFNGTLNYAPNLNALNMILNEINPILLTNTLFKYKIIICGKGLPESYHDLELYKNENIVFAGFVDDVTVYFKATDIFINPVIDGGGIKTKIVEALGYNVSLVTTTSGAIGIPPEITGNKMKIIADNNWLEFAKAIVEMDTTANIPESYFNHFYWGNIAKKAAAAIGTAN
jgi:UDP-N-acetylglucosamine:LPS N-acetylglucosamine transferase